MIREFKVANWHNFMDLIDAAERKGKHGGYFQDDDGIIHKIYVFFDNSNPQPFTLNINDFDMGDTYKNMGEVYDCIMTCCNAG